MPEKSEELVKLEINGGIAVITNNRPDKYNAFTDEMDIRLFEILKEISQNKGLRAVIWRGEGKNWSSGRDVSAIGSDTLDIPHHELMVRGHRGIQGIFDLSIPIIVAVQGWAIGGSFQRALLCDIRIAAEDAKFMLPELTHGVIPDTGGVACLYEMAGHGLVSDMVLCKRVLNAEEALAHGIVSRVVPPGDLDAVALEMAQQVAAAPQASVKMARRVIRAMSDPAIRRSMDDELVFQTFINQSHDFAEFKKARSEEREPKYRGS